MEMQPSSGDAAAKDASPSKDSIKQKITSDPGEPILRLSRNITVRRLRPSDATIMTQHVNNPAIAHNLSDRYRLPYPEERAAEVIASATDPANFVPTGKGKPNPANNGCIEWTGPAVPTRYAIAIDDAMVGVASLRFGTMNERRTASFGYWIAQEYWGRGIVTEVTRAFLRWCWETFDDILMRIEGGAYAWNPASCRILEKLGFRYVGRREDAIWKDEQLVDTIEYGMTRAQYYAAS